MKTNAAIRAGLRRFCMRAKPKGSLKAAVFNEVKTEKPSESRKKQPETFTKSAPFTRRH